MKTPFYRDGGGKPSASVWSGAIGSGYREQCSYADLWLGTDLVSSNLPVVSGQVVTDATQAVRSSCDLTLSADGLDPVVLDLIRSRALATSGYELRVYHGLRVSGKPAVCQLGVFVIEGCKIREVSGELDITAWDRTRQVGRSATTVATYIPGGADGAFYYEDYIEWLVRMAVPYAVLDISGDKHIIDQGFTVAAWDNPLDTLLSWASLSECEFFASPSGVLTWRPAPVVADRPDFVIQTGSNLVDLELDTDGGLVHNMVSAENSDGSIVAKVYNNSSGSRTRWGGPFGNVPYRYQSSSFSSVAAATRAAGVALRELSSAGLGANVTAVCDPRIDVGDTVQIDSSTIGWSGVGLVSGCKIALGSDPTMAVVIKEVQDLW